MELPLTGRRRETEGWTFPQDMSPGDFWLEQDGTWWVYVPGGPVCCIVNHHVREHRDGSISVVPGPWGSNSIVGHRFHGWIERGAWTEAAPSHAV